MKKNIWKITAILICIGVLINILSFNIKAEEHIAIVGTSIGDTVYLSDSTENLFIRRLAGSDEIRVACVGTSESSCVIWYVAQTTSNSNQVQQRGSGAGSQKNLNSSKLVDGVSYYYISYASGSGASSFKTGFVSAYGFIESDSNSIDAAIPLMFNDSEDVTYGELIISYKQNLYTEHPENNLDMITWNAYRDTAGNDLQGKKIEIQAYAGYFEGSSYADLKQTRFSDWLASTHPAVTMYKGDIEISHQEYTWGTVASNFRSINTLGTWFWNIFTSENTWYQYGWRYRARLLDEDEEPLTEWQIIYTGNSYSPTATETLTDDEPLTPDDVDTINDINDENGTTNNWYINNTVITNNEYNETYQQNIIENIYNILQGSPDEDINHKADDVQQTIDNAIDTEDDYLNDLQTQLNDLELNDITQNNGLMKALRWVREVHHETIENTELAGVVLTIMLIGLITYLIGRRNG